jgi:hypothetical protein
MVEAKLLYKTDTGRVFNLDHAWAILRHSKKWSKDLEEASGRGKSKAKSEPIDVDNSSADHHTSTTDGPPSDATTRPEGQKKAKKRKNDDVQISDLIKGQNELLELSRQKQKLFDSFADNMNMSRDLTGMDKETLEYFRAKRRIVINRMKAEEKASTS